MKYLFHIDLKFYFLIFLINLINHRNELLAILQNSRIDIALISETHLTNVSHINLPSFQIIKSNHSDGTAFAGTTIIVRLSLLFYPLPQYQAAHTQACGISLTLNNIPINICAIYSPPSHSITPKSLPALLQYTWPKIHNRWRSKCKKPTMGLSCQ